MFSNGHSPVTSDGFYGAAPVSRSRQLAEQLRVVLVKHNKLMRQRLNLGKWSQSFRRVMQVRSFEELTKLIQLYDAHLGDTYCPQMFSADSFCEKLPAFESFLSRLRATGRNNEVKVVSSQAIQLAAELSDSYYWSKGSSDHLPSAIQTTLDNYNAFLTSVHKVKRKCKGTDVGLFAAWLDNELEPPVDFARRWYVAEAERVREWEGWSGTLSSFDLDKKRTNDMGRGWAHEWCGQTVRWSQLLDAFLELS